ncbi:MAG: hypothetical protein HQK50_10585 [Oligoflexia bacterium]|nr:hypothetical protein [Oligoflexia bacterium]MBF0366007.1 hypothetical protein [Oligoflexia bacterium]
MKLLKESVMQFLPHRDPFLFIDSVEDIWDAKGVSFLKEDGSPTRLVENVDDLSGLRIRAHFYVDAKMPILQGHFPGRPILPGVVQVEMMAQAACFGIRPLYAELNDVQIEVHLMKIESAKFRRPILPGMQLTIEAICTKRRGSMHCYQCMIRYENEVMSECEVMAHHKF